MANLYKNSLYRQTMKRVVGGTVRCASAFAIMIQPAATLTTGKPLLTSHQSRDRACMWVSKSLTRQETRSHSDLLNNYRSS